MMLALRRDAFQAVISMPMSFADTRSVGDLNSRISADITAVQDVFTTTLAELLRQLIIIIGGIAALLYFSVTLTLLMLATLPVMIIAAMVFGKAIRKLSKATQDQVATSNTLVQDALTGIVGVKSTANEALEILRYLVSAREIKSLAMRGAIGRGAFSSFIILFIFGAITLVIFKGAELMSNGGLASEHFFTFLLMTGLVAGSIGGIAAMFGQLQRGLGAIDALMDLLSEPREAVRTATELPATGEEPLPEGLEEQARDWMGRHTASLRGDFRFEGVHFHYPNRPDVEVLKGVDLEIRQGEQVALVGASGAGKSTLAALLLRFHAPDQGRITLNGEDIGGMELSAYRQRLAYVPQEVILFGGDIRSNIAYGRPGASTAEVEEAARRAYSLDFIRGFPEGMGTRVGERGVQLSGGQRQRIAIARAILRDPDLLILDEATSALDTASEKEVQAALEALMAGRSSLVIAHRLSTIRNAHRIAVLEAGRVVEIGTHDDLIAELETYYGDAHSQGALICSNHVILGDFIFS
jgi:ABC-type multidrug transport system fused ATPase/permease subunit